MAWLIRGRDFWVRGNLLDASDILKLGCSHPNAWGAFKLGDPAEVYLCLNPHCEAEYSVVETHFRTRYP